MAQRKPLIFSPRLLAGAMALTTLLVLQGCTSKKDEGLVTGIVTYRGQPLGAGIVTLHPKGGGANSAPTSGQIAADGSYSVGGCPPGPATITVETAVSGSIGVPGGANAKDLSMGGMAGKAIPIPAKYKDPNTSGLSMDVKVGKQKYDINLD